jgi:hypothetical protein
MRQSRLIKLMCIKRNVLGGFLIAILIFNHSCKRKEVPFQDFSHPDPAQLTKGDTITPFRFIHATTGDWKVEIRISADDLLDVSKKVASRKFTTTDPEILERIRNLKFLYGVGRIHKASSTLRIYDHVNVYEQHGIVFEKNYLALQSKRYGIIRCIDEAEFFSIMEDMY